jgi:uncharacterized protein involved in response to NO
MAKPSLLDAGPAAFSPTKLALFRKGFRPFFLLAGVYAALAVPLWLLALNGMMNPGAYFGGIFWHAHEMLFGYAVAVIAGFLLTAIGNWTSKETAVGWPLAALTALWIIGRVAVLFADRMPRPLAAVLDLAFLPVLAVVCARPMVATKNQRNYPFVGMLTALFVANLLMHLHALGVTPGFARKGAWFATHVIILMIVVMSGRVVPMFTRNATGKKSIRNLPRLDTAAAIGVLLVALADLATLDERFVASLSAVAGVLVFARSRTWGTGHTWREPLLWVLHAGHAFIALGLILRGVASLTPAVSASAALHALTVGGIGSLTLGMMARVSLGHTGRTLAVKPAIGAAFAAMMLSASVRVFGPLGGSTAYAHSITAAGVLFALAFALFLWVYVPVLVASRVDGRPG